MAPEKRLIDAVRFRETLDRYANAPHVTLLNNHSRCMRMAIETCMEFLDMQRAVDAVPVVRCKDCKWWKTSGCWFHQPGKCAEREADDFCSDGERRTNGQD